MRTIGDLTVDTPTYVDGLGRRLRLTDSNGEDVEMFRLCRELSEAATSEAALVERAGKLAAFTHPSFSQIRRVERLSGALGGLAVVSAAVPGVRLAEILALAERKWMAPDFDAALYLLQQVATAMAALHRHSRDFSHGALGPERIVVRPDGHPVIVEHLLAPAIGELQINRAALWSQFRIPAPAVAGAARLDQLTDIMQLGMLALALVLGRPIRREEFPQKLQDVLAEASTPGALGPRPAIARPLHGWILRALQSESRAAFRTVHDAAAALDALIVGEPRRVVSPLSVVAWVDACHGPASSVLPAAAQPIASPLRTEAEATTQRPVPEGDFDGACGSATTARPDHSLTVRRVPPARWTETQRIRRRDDAGSRRSRRTVEVSRTGAADAPPDGSVLRPARAWEAVRRRVSSLNRSSVWRAVRVVVVAAGLVGLFGATYLGARGYLGFPGFLGRSGTLVVESRPAGAEVFVDGLPHGRTPATLELTAGEHTVALRVGTRTTLVPVVVVAGARRVERVEIPQRRQGVGRPQKRTVSRNSESLQPRPAQPVQPASALAGK